MNIVLSNYFISKKDPQRNIRYKHDDPNLVDHWIKSLTELNVNGVIFHDCLSDAFIKKHETEFVKFEYYKPETKLSLNDERFICWFNWLCRNKSKIDNVFCTDLFDLQFNKNPFELISDRYRFYTGKVIDVNIEDRPYMRDKMVDSYGEIKYGKRKYGCACCFGGSYKNVVDLLILICADFMSLDNTTNINMAVFNKNMYDLFPESQIMLGYPITNKFTMINGKLACDDRFKDYYIRHK